jgi:hypothetical protein
MGEICNTYRGKEKCLYDFGGKTRRNETTINTQRWVDNIKIVLSEIEWGGVD